MKGNNKMKFGDNSTDINFLSTECHTSAAQREADYFARQARREEEIKEKESDLNKIEAEVPHYVRQYCILFNNINNAKTAKEKAMYEEKRNFTKEHIKKWTILKSKALENQK